jgi:hypothetical protein
MTLVETSQPGHRGREGTRRRLLEMRDRFSASDPGLGRLRGATAVTVGVGTSLLLQQAVARAAGITGVAAFSMTLFGAVVAMLGSNALSGMCVGRWCRRQPGSRWQWRSGSSSPC